MKHIVLTNEAIEQLLETEVQLAEDGSDREAAFEKMRQLIWQIILNPMEQQKEANLDFIYDFMKCKDAILDVIKNPEKDRISLEDKQFTTLLNTFKAFNNWNLQIGRVILTASECLDKAMMPVSAPPKKSKGKA
jgi:uncharacterized membrane protein YccC